MASHSAPGAPVEIRVACHAPTVPAYRPVLPTRGRYMLPSPDAVAARELARPPGPFRLLPAEMPVPRLEEPHLTGEAAEDFVGSALSDSALAGAQERLLLCERCRRRVEALDRFVAACDPPPSARTSGSGFSPGAQSPAPSRLLKWSFRRPEEGKLKQVQQPSAAC